MTERTPEMQSFVDALGEACFGRSQSSCRPLGICVVCGQTIQSFRDELSRKEFRISGMCQECQDSVFGV